MTLSPWWLLAAAVPVLLLGELLVHFLPLLARFDLPAPIVGGLTVAVAILLLHMTGVSSVRPETKLASAGWNWIVTPTFGPQSGKPAAPIFLPFSTAFFTTVGLSASWSVARKGSWQLMVLLTVATVLGEAQNLAGMGMCQLLHRPPLLGVLCGSVTLTGGPSTALAFADKFTEAGVAHADVIGAAAAMFGIVAASVLGGAFGGVLIRRLHLSPSATPQSPAAPPLVLPRTRTTLWSRFVGLLKDWPSTLLLVLIVLLLMKVGAFASAALSRLGVTLPVYMGALLCGVLLRNGLDAMGIRIIRDDIVAGFGAVVLGIFLAMAIAGLDLAKLRDVAGPMLLILSMETVLTLVFCAGVTFVVLGRDYDAAVAAAGHVGFGLGITPNAVASVDVLERTFGLSPRGLLIVTVVGAFLIDFTNALLITFHLNLAK